MPGGKLRRVDLHAAKYVICDEVAVPTQLGVLLALAKAPVTRRLGPRDFGVRNVGCCQQRGGFFFCNKQHSNNK